MRFSQRVEKLSPYLFVEINRLIAEKRSRGERVISFAIGDPDLPTPEHIIDSLCQAARDPANHHYPETIGLQELREAIAQWYLDRFGVYLDPDSEIVPLIGSKEGIGHLSFCLLDPGDIALVPDPGYPVYAAGAILAGATPYYMPLLRSNHFLPQLEEIPAEVAHHAKLLWVNYPNNPTGAVANKEFFDQVVRFALLHDIVVCHDAAYTEITFDGYRAPSLLEVPEAREVGIEFHSLSKSYCMTGWRIGMAVGDAKLIEVLRNFKSNLDSGIPQFIQRAAITALTGPQGYLEQERAIYKRRRNKLLDALDYLGFAVEPPLGGLYIWAGVPPGYNSASLTEALLEQASVVVTPGTGYGRNGEGYVRFSLTLPDDEFEEGIRRLYFWKESQG